METRLSARAREAQRPDTGRRAVNAPSWANAFDLRVFALILAMCKAEEVFGTGHLIYGVR